MSLQVDLLKKAERRYQGIVSMKLMVLGSLSVLVGTLVLVLILAGISRASLRANLERSQREWERVQPLAAAVRAHGVAAEANAETLRRTDAWMQGRRAPMHEILRETQRAIPSQIQLQSLHAGIVEIEQSDEPSSYILRLGGRARGKLVAVEAKRTLNKNETIIGFCGDVRLISSEREAGEVWTFALEGQWRVEGASK